MSRVPGDGPPPDHDPNRDHVHDERPAPVAAQRSRPDHTESADDRARHDTVAMTGRPKTSAAAVFAVVFGVSAIICGLLIVLFPVAILFGLIAVVLGVIGMMKASEPRVAGRYVALGGLVLGLLGLLLGIAVPAGLSAALSDQQFIQQLERGLTDLREELPTELPTP